MPPQHFDHDNALEEEESPQEDADALVTTKNDHPNSSSSSNNTNNNNNYQGRRGLLFYNNEDALNEEFRLREMEDQVQSAIRSLDKRTRRAYCTAMEVVPDLVERETRLVDFLRTENYNIAQTAQRLALYWKYRKELCGDRWLLPMTQTGTGALTKRDVQLLRSGYGYFISRAHLGQGLLTVSDSSRFPPDFCPVVHARLTLYVATVLTDIPSQTQGATVVYIAQTSQRTGVPVRANTDPTAWDVINTAAPLRVQQMIVARSFVPGKDGILNFLTYQEARTNEYRSGRQANQIVGKSLRHTLSLLEQRGLHRQHVPACLGGEYQYSIGLDNWIRRRLSVEDIMSAASPVVQAASLNAVARVGRCWNSSIFGARETEFALGTTMNGILSTTTTTTGETIPLDDVSDAVHLPLAVGNMVYRPTTTTMGDERGLLVKNAIDKGPKKRRKTTQTKQQPAGMASLTAKELNALYARRAYHKRKLETLALQEQVNELKCQRAKLQQESQRLQALARQAQAIVTTWF